MQVDFTLLLQCTNRIYFYDLQSLSYRLGIQILKSNGIDLAVLTTTMTSSALRK
ncbi:hypothetical protein LEP1GSC073_1565 [Leptospira noguchii str. Cascata]|nr:hypothetical protein LEP1GSC072_1845 [Leptospira noguchii str. Bonito]EMS81793.1 hypothetical protein LEP1GSC073_1565 [Leptospira noguchii str. Cascata]